MPSLVSGRIGDRRLFPGRATGMQKECIRREAAVALISITLNITDIPPNLVIRILYLSGKQRDGIRINLWNFIRKPALNILSAWGLIMIISFYGIQRSINGIQ